MGSFVTFATPWMRIISCAVFVRRSILVSRVKRLHEPLRAGQCELKCSASRLICVCPQPAAVGFNDGPADRQPHSHSAGLRGVEGIENALDMSRINARPRIAHRDENPICPAFVSTDPQRTRALV